MNEQLSRSFSNLPVLVTGGAGFIGSNLVLRLADYGANVTALDALIPQHGGNLLNLQDVHGSVSINICDMDNRQILEHLVADKKIIFHLAGQVSHGDSMREPNLDLRVNCIATMNLLEACRTVNTKVKIIHSSTRQVYGIPRFLPVTEDHPVLPIDVNGINKLAAEYYHLLYDTVYGIHSTVLRLTNTYGPRQQIRNDRQGFAGIFIRKALRGECIELYGSGQQLRDFNFVDDVVDALLLAAITPECHGSVYNLGMSPPYTLIDFLTFLNTYVPLEYRLVPFPDDRKIIDIGDYYGDYSRFSKLTGWQPHTTLEDGLGLTVEFFNRFHEDYV